MRGAWEVRSALNRGDQLDRDMHEREIRTHGHRAPVAPERVVSRAGRFVTVLKSIARRIREVFSDHPV
ncbi:hypothetical protein ACWGI8_01570 [Streptomyces sp. NPDC054841]